MSMQSHYTIYVAKRISREGRESYVHLFVTGSTLVTIEQAHDAYSEIVRAFPAPSYTVGVTHWQAAGTDMTHAFTAREERFRHD